MVDPASVAEAVATVTARIRAAAHGRAVQLVAVTKGFDVDAITAAVAAGCTAVGENYAQELQQKARALPTDDAWARPELHFIGQLQTNKVRSIASIVDVWQTVDRISLADEIAKRAPEARVFVQVNMTDEPQKGGCAPADAPALVEHCRTKGLRLEGLMTIGPTSTHPVDTAAAFASLRVIADQVGVEGLSMGMSGDFELAIAHGATHVRIGGALFGPRPYRRTQIG
ncbi:MAG: hypothetical protein JWN39_944 [Ilumatobacteraceae bacterium]|nr:hypothetical protein [Ilumatobacteraceae bacterium]